MRTGHFLRSICITIGCCVFVATASASDACKGNGEKYSTCMDKQEAEIIKKYPKLMERKGNNLILKPLHGNPPKVFTDITSPESEGNYVKHWLVDYYPKYRISYIKASYSEGYNAFVYHHEYGSEQEVVGDIVFSADNKYMVSYNSGGDAEYTLDVVRVFLLGGHWLERLSSFENMGFGVEKAEFVANDRILLTTTFYGQKSNDSSGLCYLKRYGRIWQFEQLTCMEPVTQNSKEKTK